MNRAPHHWRALLLAAVMALVAGCDKLHIPGPSMPTPDKLIASGDPSPEVAKTDAVREATVGIRDPNQPIMSVPPRPNSGVLHEVSIADQKGAGLGAASRVPGSAAEGPTQPVQLQFADASLRAVVDFLFQQYLKKPYTVLPDFKDHKVNWIASGRFTEPEILRMFEAFLEVQGVSMTEREGMYVVANGPQRETLAEPEIGQTTGMWRLSHVDAKEVVGLARFFITNPDRIQVSESSNLLIATAGGTEIRSLDAFISRIDVPPMNDLHIMVYTPRYMTAAAVVAMIQAMPKKIGSSLPDSHKAIDADVVVGQPEVVIVVRDPSMLKLVASYLNEIDNPNQDQRQVFYYTVRTQKADDVRTTLDALLKPLFKEDQQAPSVIAHLPTNSLIITATPDQYYQIKSVIDRLDFSLPSVLLDAVVAEVSLNDELAYGVEWFLRGRAGQGVGDISTATDPFAAGLTQVAAPTATVGALSLVGDVVSTLNLLSQKTKLQVLSRPRVIVANKEKATIKSVLEEQILASNSNSAVQVNGASQILNQYQSKEVGITLEVTPTIADDGTLKLLLHLEDSTQGPLTNGQPSFDKRQVDTTLIATSGQTIFIGGIIKTQNNDNELKVPGLGDIPFIGNAFKANDTAVASSELIIMLTPHVFSSEASAKLITDAFSGFAAKAK